jgi:hypothetical protein
MIRNLKFAVLLIVIASAVLSPDGGGVGMVAMGAPVIVLYILSVGLAWAFGKSTDTATTAQQSQQAILFMLSADWLRHKAAELLSPRTTTKAMKF